MVRHVAAGIDGSSESLAAAHWAAREAARRGSALELVHAWEWRPDPSVSVPVDGARQDWAERALARVAAGVRAAHPGLDVGERLVEEDPVTVLLAAADEAELLVLGSRGLTGVAGFVVGSVSQRVVARSGRPVVLVRAGADAAAEHLPAVDGVSPEEIPEVPYRDVVLGLDAGAPGDETVFSDELIGFAFEAAHRRGAPLRVVHAFGGGAERPDPAPSSGAGLLADHTHAVAAALRPWREKWPDTTVAETVTEGRPADELVRAAAGAGLLVVGRRERGGGPGPRLGPVAHAVLHHAACPVAVVPHS
ncbi:universal stress protein [Streptomyces poonensis]|uniref:Stress-inducible protein n=1 Tax=Streptomyces poonensis TaxID=68255 RepID=A0A918QCW4_9ACTN|nr:universal stress protein [Streptomyces poonensis]GGZ42450.1 stress-inducible protein [Streptomyces poonensis]GLJ92767.1 stress-inducible protein [Streptomyces poonensis]